MTRLRTGHKRRTRKCRKPFPQAALRRFVICNRFAASPEGRRVRVGVGRDRDDADWLYFRDAFYSFKDDLLAHYGQRVGYALQVWRTGWDDYDYGFDPQACEHRHILACWRLRDRVFHIPTGEFSFYNSLSDYGKSSQHFQAYRDLATRRIEGRKQVSDPPDRHQAFAAFRWLWRRYRAVPDRDRTARHLIPGTREFLAVRRQRERQEREERERLERHLAELSAMRIECRWCCVVQDGHAYRGGSRGEKICAQCWPKYSANAGDSEIPF